MIGYDAGAADMRRRNHAGSLEDPLYSYEYPLIEWGWDREKCQSVIASEGIPVPSKSACYFCPATKPHELHSMGKELLKKIVMIESRAHPHLKSVEGLWRSSTKTRSGRMTDYIRAQQLLTDEEVDSVITQTPTQPLFKEDIDNWQAFIKDICLAA